MRRLLGWAKVAVVPLAVLILLVPPFRAVAFSPFDDRPQLDPELRSAVVLIDATVAEVGQGRTVSLVPVNIAQSRSDQGTLSEGISYDRCDDWKAWFFPGWAGGKSYEIGIKDGPDGEALLAEVRTYWEGLGYSVERFENEILVNRGHTKYSLSVPANVSSLLPIESAILSGGTDCLPDD